MTVEPRVRSATDARRTVVRQVDRRFCRRADWRRRARFERRSGLWDRERTKSERSVPTRRAGAVSFHTHRHDVPDRPFRRAVGRERTRDE